MRLVDLQCLLKNTGRYFGELDGLWGSLTKAAIITALTDGPDTPLREKDYQESAERLGVEVAAIKAVVAVESSGAGFFAGKPVILAEPHRFSRSTGHRYDNKYPTISYRSWGARPYPKTQEARYQQLLQMIRLDVDAGFMSASYGKFQILGENYAACGYSSPAEFAFAMARDEREQLKAFEGFIRSKGLLQHLRNKNWARFAEGYNGTGYRKNRYDSKLAAAYDRYNG